MLAFNLHLYYNYNERSIAMIECVEQMLVQFVDILKVVIPMYCVFDIAGDLMFKNS